ncbi:hypothetical protein [Dyadobacter sandarakinus]|uniref:Uncharacterized protein n=1 Tax=Dyadobacter sandarakinus TaxID=2747268 RepID=A0ABX7IEQ3_9BACT|nr:hypothetical protein [Dyadobacter sandarakinus]QRR03366.1 hypothetical protein HWI92_21840 [Dyadobacter sandarakinus]
MGNQAAFYQLIYGNEMLFRVAGETPQQPAPRKEPDTQPAPEVPVKTIAPPEPVQPVILFPELRHKVLVMVDEPAHAELLPEEAALLDNVLKAVGYSNATADLLNYKFLPGHDARAVLSGRTTNYFITFGVPLIRLHIDLMLVPYTPKLVEGIWFLLADPLVVVGADKNLKKKLWQALQLMFKPS